MGYSMQVKYYGTLLANWLTIATLGAVTPAHTQNIKFELPDGPNIQVAVNKLPADQQVAVRQAAAEVFPLFIFLPGIMGSRLTKTLTDGRQKLIWGQSQGIFTPPDSDLAYAETDVVKAEVMDEYFVAGTSFDVYGSAVRTIRYMDFTMGDNVRLFAYDWRQSNGKSARDFTEWLCKNQDEIKKRPLVLLAHSMGGLVLKSWLKDAYESKGCTDGQKFSDFVRIKKIVFLGTPHYGAPKAVMAFADQYSLLIDVADSSIKRLLGGIDARTISKSVNEYGATFPSAYELLPVINTSACFKEPGWPSPIAVKQSDGTIHSDIDIFQEGMWSVLKWPKNLASDINRSKFMAERLPTLLKSAEKFLCDLSRFQPDQKFDVVRIYGANRSTICRVVINQPESGGASATVTPDICSSEDDQGDGTVPKWVASEDKYSLADKIRMSAQSHMQLVGSPEFLTYLRSYKTELHRELQRKYAASVGNVDGLVTMYASLQSVVPSALASNDPNDVSSQIARRVIATLGVAPTSIFATARSEADPLARADAYRIFADVTPSDDLVRAWALNNAAHIYLERKDFVAARKFGKLAVKAADEGKAPKTTKAFSDFFARAGATTAVAAEQLNDYGTASAFRKIAADPNALKTYREFMN
jgi:pimeloyl-ACP methyl ester carboxylesterase